MSVIDSENKIKEQLKYIQTEKERAKVPEVNRDDLRRCVVNEQLFYRAMNK